MLFRAAALAFLCLAGPAAASPRTSAAVGMSVEPTGLDPTVAAPVAIGQVTWQNVYQGLVRIDRTGAVRPQLASSWTVSPDGLVYTFALRTGVHFQDGEPFDAASAKFTLDRARGPASTNPQKQFFSAIDAVEAPDPATLVVRLRQPSADLLYWLGWPASVMLAPKSADADRTDPVGTGPFRVARWVRGDRVELVRDPGYWDADHLPALESATFRFVPDPQAQAAALRAGGLDAVPELGAPELFAAFKGDPAFDAVAGTTGLKVVAGMNCARAPFDDVRVRRALMMAVDRRALIDAASSGFGTPIGSHFAPGDPGYIDLAGVLPYDPAKARALLAEAGHGDRLAFSIRVPQMAYATRTAEVLQAMFADVGVTMTIVPTEFPATWIADVFKRHDFDMTVVAHAEPLDIGIYARPDYYFGFHDGAFDADIAAAERALDPAHRDAAYRDAERVLAEDVPALYLYVLPKLGVWNAKLRGLWADEPIPSNDLTEVRWTE
ncbi:ABC transporter substrate-binding protein [Lichenibacterium dinghuense]|uniref:ABC transporter substrate-binding protein n=1 Tax=Lichenibacterium dinghuense TaxID=2895977 RepID=UPI001F42F5E1|nr:ABC transporter substrate-binding protein [Lichenibacterium sp. 6Y81]